MQSRKGLSLPEGAEEGLTEEVSLRLSVPEKGVEFYKDRRERCPAPMLLVLKHKVSPQI